MGSSGKAQRAGLQSQVWVAGMPMGLALDAETVAVLLRMPLMLLLREDREEARF